METQILIIFGTLIGIFFYFLIALCLMEHWVMQAWNETVSVKNKKHFGMKCLIRFCKFCCVIWPVGVPLMMVLGVLYLAFFYFGDE